MKVWKGMLVGLWVGVMVLVGIAGAENVTWDGASDGDGDGVSWSDSLNWDGDVLPQTGDSVLISGDVTPGALVSYNLRGENVNYLTLEGQESVSLRMEVSSVLGVGLQFLADGASASLELLNSAYLYAYRFKFIPEVGDISFHSNAELFSNREVSFGGESTDWLSINIDGGEVNVSQGSIEVKGNTNIWQDGGEVTASRGRIVFEGERYDVKGSGVLNAGGVQVRSGQMSVESGNISTPTLEVGSPDLNEEALLTVGPSGWISWLDRLWVGVRSRGRFVYQGASDIKLIHQYSLPVDVGLGDSSAGGWGELVWDSEKMLMARYLRIGSGRGDGRFVQKDGKVLVMKDTNLGTLTLPSVSGAIDSFSEYLLEAGEADLGSLYVYGVVDGDNRKVSRFIQRGGEANYYSVLLVSKGGSPDGALYKLESGKVCSSSLDVGSAEGPGMFQQESGLVNVDRLHLQGGGLYSISGGSLDVTDPNDGLVEVNQGRFSQSGGIMQARDFLLHSREGELAKVQISGGEMDILNIFRVDSTGEAKVVVTDGNLSARGVVFSTPGEFVLSGGSVVVDTGFSMIGDYLQTGGDLRVGGVWVVNDGPPDMRTEVRGGNVSAGGLRNYSEFYQFADITVGSDGVYNRGRWYGEGKVEFTDSSGEFVHRGALFPGGSDSPGRMEIWGDLDAYGSWNSGSSFFFDLAGYIPQVDYDVLRIYGEARLDYSNIFVNLLDGFDPQIGSVFDLIWAEDGLIFGDNVNVNLPLLEGGKWFEWEEDGHSFRVVVKGPLSVVPEPASTGLFLVGLISLIRLRRKK